MQSSLFQQNVSLTLRLLVITVICIVLMTVDHRNNALKGFRSTVGSYLVYPLQYLASLPAGLFQNPDKTIVTRKQLLAQNNRLNQENLQLKAQLLKLASLEEENERLRKLMGAASGVGEEVLIAEVVSVDQDYYKQQVLINKGSDHNVYVGQPVIDAKGIMGQVIEVNRFASTVLLISDPGHALPVQSNRGGIRSIVQGKGNPNELDLLYIPNNTALKPGDLLISSGLGGVFPPNYPVGIVSQVQLRPSQPFAQVTATPTALLDKSREVLLVWPQAEPKAEKAEIAAEAKPK
ncbi:MAG TPA: rod shape-determining protein MreC [Gammaproteobacteria bacterium]|nr:rod shape-determining protein MreC [Gammaproteobacteria bacterium]